jgi:hypothetical protein
MPGHKNKMKKPMHRMPDGTMMAGAKHKGGKKKKKK